MAGAPFPWGQSAPNTRAPGNDIGSGMGDTCNAQRKVQRPEGTTGKTQRHQGFPGDHSAQY